MEKTRFIPQRFIIAIMTMGALTVVYTMRIIIPVSTKHMVAPLNITKENSSICPNPSPVTELSHHIQDTVFPWTPSKQFITSRCFFAGYFIGHIPGGIISDLYGGKDVMSVAILVSSILTLTTPIVFKAVNGNLILVAFIKILKGICIGLIFPSAHSIISQWCPVKDRVTDHLIMHVGSWGSSYYLYGSLGVVLLPFWLLFAASNPFNCRYLIKEEYLYLRKEMAGRVQFGPKPIPWRSMLTSLPLWSLVIAQFGHGWIWHGLDTDLPKYLCDVFQIDILHSSLMASIPYAIMGFSTIIMGYISDYLINRNIIQTTTLRKALTTFGAMGPGIFLVAGGYNGYLSCNKTTAAMFFSFGLCSMSCYYAGTRVNCFDLAPNYSGIIMGLVNGIAALAGIMAPMVTKNFTKNESLFDWMYAFWIHLSVLAFTNIFFVFFGSAEEQPWNWANRIDLDENYSLDSIRQNQ
ncbi:sialin-like isoform X2 [Tribolium madens]|uniref:sialin-like isoform X2 n=1 Tax=Tribolium madens TaxID=41895 RepID=UPI001CF7511C|nr:sialin-like isoform X2 [Tribolium madens]